MSSNIDLTVERLLDPQFGSDTTERLLMGTAADTIRHLQGELAEAQAKVAHLAKQEVDIRAAYHIVRADNPHLSRENKRLEREWEAALAPVPEPEAEGEAVAWLRFTHKGFGCELSKHVAYARPEGVYAVYTHPPASEAEIAGLRAERDEAVQGAREAVLSMIFMPGVRAALDNLPDDDPLTPWIDLAKRALQALSLAGEEQEKA